MFVEKTDARLFKQIYSMEGENMFALVNMWNLQGIEDHWRNATGTVERGEEINPLGDMDLNEYSRAAIENDYLKRLTAKNSKSEPTLSGPYITQYHKTTTEPERARHAFFLGADDSHLEHSLFNDENKDVKELPYKFGAH